MQHSRFQERSPVLSRAKLIQLRRPLPVQPVLCQSTRQPRSLGQDSEAQLADDLLLGCNFCPSVTMDVMAELIAWSTETYCSARSSVSQASARLGARAPEQEIILFFPKTNSTSEGELDSWFGLAHISWFQTPLV